MDKTEIYFIDDFHGVEQFYPWQKEQLDAIKPQLVFIEMLPCEKKYIKLCRDLSRKLISVDEFRVKTDWENIWGTFKGYKELFEYLQNKRISIYPMDHSLKERNSLVDLELRIINRLKSKASICDLVDESRVVLFMEREAIFSKNILNIVRRENVKQVAVIVGKNHIERLNNFFNFLDEYKSGFRMFNLNKRTKLYQKFKDLHLAYASRRKILGMKYPPLVPINVLRYSLMNKTKND